MSPEGWQRRRVREFSERLKRVNVEGLDLEPLSITKDRGVILQSEKYNKRIATDPRKYVFAEDGDFAFDPMSLYYGAIGRVDGIGRGLVSPDYVVFRADASVDPEFLHRLLRYPEMHKLYEALSETGNTFGKRRRLYWSIFEDIELQLPPRPEQTKIAAILASVDEAIEATRAVIEQLQVVKKAMMAELLTRGLPGRHTRFKQTEIGLIPDHWSVVPLSEVAFVQTGIAKGKTVERGTAIPYLRVANVQDGHVDLGEVKIIEVDEQSVTRYSLQVGDVLFTEGGDADKLGRGCVWRGEISPCLHQNHVFAVRVDRQRLLPELLAYWAASPKGKAYFLDSAKQTTNLASINSTQLKAFPVPIASVDEQEGIINVLSAIDVRRATETQLAGQLVALKLALTSSLLTGEVRVKPDPELA